jgi:hypothetical protein
MRHQLLLCFVVVSLYLRPYFDVRFVLILCFYRAASVVVTERQALCPSNGNIEMFPLLCQVQSQIIRKLSYYLSFMWSHCQAILTIISFSRNVWLS